MGEKIDHEHSSAQPNYNFRRLAALTALTSIVVSGGLIADRENRHKVVNFFQPTEIATQTTVIPGGSTAIETVCETARNLADDHKIDPDVVDRTCVDAGQGIGGEVQPNQRIVVSLFDQFGRTEVNAQRIDY